jgi:hypothetical protein
MTGIASKENHNIQSEGESEGGEKRWAGTYYAASTSSDSLYKVP